MQIKLISGLIPPKGGQTTPAGLVDAQQRLRKVVLDTLASPHSRRNYAKALDDLFTFRPAVLSPGSS